MRKVFGVRWVDWVILLTVPFSMMGLVSAEDKGLQTVFWSMYLGSSFISFVRAIQMRMDRRNSGPTTF